MPFFSLEYLIISSSVDGPIHFQLDPHDFGSLLYNLNYRFLILTLFPLTVSSTCHWYGSPFLILLSGKPCAEKSNLKLLFFNIFSVFLMRETWDSIKLFSVG